MKNNPTTGKRKKALELPDEPIHMKSEMKFEVSIIDGDVKVKYEPSLLNDMAIVSIAREISQRQKEKMELTKAANNLKGMSADDKKYFNGRLDGLTKSILSLGAIGQDILMT